MAWAEVMWSIWAWRVWHLPGRWPDGVLSEGYVYDWPGVYQGDGQTESYLKDMGMTDLGSAWAMARRRPKEYRLEVDCPGVYLHTWPDLIKLIMTFNHACTVELISNPTLNSPDLLLCLLAWKIVFFSLYCKTPVCGWWRDLGLLLSGWSSS